MSYNIILGKEGEKDFFLNGTGQLPEKYKNNKLVYTIDEGCLQVLALNPSDKKYNLVMVAESDEDIDDYWAMLPQVAMRVMRAGIKGVTPAKNHETLDTLLRGYKIRKN